MLSWLFRRRCRLCTEPSLFRTHLSCWLDYDAYEDWEGVTRDEDGD